MTAGTYADLLRYASASYVRSSATKSSTVATGTYVRYVPYRAFDISVIQFVAAKAVGAGACVSITEMEGSVTKAFPLVVHSKRVVEAWNPSPSGEPKSSITASEVVTMDMMC